jgi:hypothetical protein
VVVEVAGGAWRGRGLGAAHGAACAPAQLRVDAVGVEVVHAPGEHAHRLAVGEVGQAHRARRLAPGLGFLYVRAHLRRSLDQVHPRRRAHVHADSAFFLLLAVVVVVEMAASSPAVVAAGDDDAVVKQEHRREAHDAQQPYEHRRVVRRRAHLLHLD